MKKVLIFIFAILLLGSFASANLNDGLVRYYNMSAELDSTGNSDLTLHGYEGDESRLNGMDGNYTYLEAREEGWSIPYTFTDVTTINFWTNYSETAFFGSPTWTSTGWFCSIIPPVELKCRFDQSSSEDFYTGIDLNNGTWTMVTLIYMKNGTLKAYQDGTLTNTATINPINFQDNIISDLSAYYATYRKSFDEFSIYNK